jgi:septal ring-binding cell division protein DamX
MSSASEKKRRNLTIALGIASALSFGGMYGVIARGSGGGTETQAASLVLDQTTFSELTTPDATVAPVIRRDDDEGEENETEADDEDDADEDESRVSVATVAPTAAPTSAPATAPTAAPTPVTKTRGS